MEMRGDEEREGEREREGQYAIMVYTQPEKHTIEPQLALCIRQS